jgi:hypothetical protein
MNDGLSDAYNTFEHMTDEEFFQFAKEELADIKKELRSLQHEAQALVDKAQQKHILNDILHNH